MAKKKTVIIDDLSKDDIEKIHERFAVANEKSLGFISDFFDKGYLTMLAQLLFYLPEDRREQALAKLPEPVRQNVHELFLALGEKKNSDPEVVSTAGYVLKKAGFYGKKSADEVIGNDYVSLQLSQTDYDNFFAINPLLAMNVEYYNINLSFITNLDDRAVQKWLREADQSDLAKALRGADDEVRDKVFRNMSRRAAAMLQEDMDFMGPVRRKDIIEAQKKLVNILFMLNEEGSIVMSAGFEQGLGEELV